jgi:hypothetical protein
MEGVTTSNTIKIARTSAPVSREITALYLQIGQARYDAAPLFHFVSADCDGLPHSCQSFAYFHFAPQYIVKIN